VPFYFCLPHVFPVQIFHNIISISPLSQGAGAADLFAIRSSASHPPWGPAFDQFPVRLPALAVVAVGLVPVGSGVIFVTWFFLI